MENILSHLAKDPVLAPLAKSSQLRKLAVSDRLYESLLESIVSQQLSVKASDTIHNRFLNLFPGSVPNPETLLGLDEKTLRSAGLSHQKIGYLREIARTFLEKDLLHRDFSVMTDGEIILTLTAIKGVGIWTVQMLLIFSLGRGDVFAPGDLIVRQMVTKLYGLAETGKALEKRMEEISRNWSPYRSTACRLFWERKDLLSRR
jgi:DNA-3-methyladenine glycosylase II